MSRHTIRSTGRPLGSRARSGSTEHAQQVHTLSAGRVPPFPPGFDPTAGLDRDGFDGPRACDPYELGATLDLINLVLRTQPSVGPPRAPTFGWDFAHIYNHDNLANVRIVCHDGRPVSSVGIYLTDVRTPLGTIRVGGINGVVTHPDYRGRGLNTATLVDAHTQMRDAWVQVGLLETEIVDYYRRLGWERAGRERRFVFDERSIGDLPAAADLDINDDWRECVGELCRIHDREPLAAERTEVQFARLAARRAERVFVARRHSTAVAYAAVKGAVVREYAGANEDVAALLRCVFFLLKDQSARSTPAQAGRFEMTVVSPDSNVGLPARLAGLGVPSTLDYLGMMFIVDPPGLFETLAIDADLERHDAHWRIRDSHGTADLTDGELTTMVFGPEGRPDERSGVFPVEFFQWPLDCV